MRTKPFQGNKNSGTKTKGEFFREMVNMGLANSIMNEELLKIKADQNRTVEQVKTLVVPFALKGVTEKVDVSTLGESLNKDNSKIDELVNLLSNDNNELYKRRNTRSNGKNTDKMGGETSN